MNNTLTVEVTGEVIFDSPAALVEKVILDEKIKYRFHQLIDGHWLLTGQSSGWEPIFISDLNSDQQEDLSLGIIIPTQRDDIPFIRTA